MELRNIEIADVVNGIDTINNSYRIAHLSDTHVSPEYNRWNILKLKRLLSRVTDEGYDHVVITGDIAGHGEERDFRSVRRILKYFGLLRYEKLTVTIGNHDIFGGVHRAEDLLSFRKHCRSVNYAEKIDLFERAFKETFPEKAYESERIFPFIKIIGPVAFIGINSVRPFHSARNPFGSNGHVSGRQLDAVRRILSHPSISGLKKIILIHHHFNKYRPHSESRGRKLYHLFESHTLKLQNRKKVEDVFKEYKVDAVLHGHTHVAGIYSNSGIIYSSVALNPIRGKNGGKELSSLNEVVITNCGNLEIGKPHIRSDYSRDSEKSLQEK